MSVSSCTLIDDSFSFSDGKATYTQTYRIKCSDPADTGLDAVDGATSALPDALPIPYATHPDDPAAFAKQFGPTKRMSRDNARCFHEVDVQFGPLDSTNDEWDGRDDPLTRPVRITPYTEDIEEVVEQGWTDVALPGIGLAIDDFAVISNAAGKEPGTPLTQTRRLSGLRFTINVATLADAQDLRADFENKLNDATFYDALLRTVLCRTVDISEEMLAGSGASYHEVSFNTVYREEGWSVPIVNRGYEFLNDDDELQMAREDDDNPKSPLVTEPCNLDLDGTRIPAGTIGTSIPWRINDEADFSDMGVGG